MAVDILPSELPRDASFSFSEALAPFVPALAAADFSRPYEELEIPGPIRKALILHKGELTDEYRYIASYLEP